MSISQIPTGKNVLYWLISVSLSAAAFAFGGWINAEHECAKRERQIQIEADERVKHIILSCEEQKRIAQEELRAFMLQSADRYTTLAREIGKKK